MRKEVRDEDVFDDSVCWFDIGVCTIYIIWRSETAEEEVTRSVRVMAEIGLFYVFVHRLLVRIGGVCLKTYACAQ